MAYVQHTLESQPSGTVVSAANSEGPSSWPFNAVSIGSGATLTYDDTHAHAVGMGTRALKVQTAAGAGITTVNWTTGAPPASLMYGRAYLYFEANPPANLRFFQALGAGANFAALNLSTTGKIASVRATGGIVNTSTTTLSINTLYRIEWGMQFSATLGQCDFKIFTGDSTSELESLIGTGSQNFGGATADEYRFGINVSQANQGPLWIDDPLVNDGTGYPGPWLPKMPAPRAPRRVRTSPGALLQV